MACKLGVFVSLVGLDHEPVAKLGTMVLLIPLLMVYNHLVVVLRSPPRLVLVVGSFYAALFLYISLALNAHTQTVNEKYPQGVPGPTGYGSPLGWLVYWLVKKWSSYPGVSVCLTYFIYLNQPGQLRALVASLWLCFGPPHQP